MLWDEPKIFFLERRYFFSIILSEFLKNRVALQLQKKAVSLEAAQLFLGITRRLWAAAEA